MMFIVSRTLPALLFGLVSLSWAPSAKAFLVARLTLAELCQKSPLNSRCIRVQQGLPSVETGVSIPDDGCDLLLAEGLELTEIQKKARSGLSTIPVVGWIAGVDSAATNFVIPANTGYQQFIGTVQSENTAAYNIELQLIPAGAPPKTVYETRAIELFELHRHAFEGSPEAEQEPAIARVIVTGADGSGGTYRVTVRGCR